MPLPILIGIGIAGLAAIFLLSQKKKIFVSYFYNGDKHYKRLLKAWDANKKFGLSFDDVSTDVSIDSASREYLRRKIAEHIRQCDVFVVLVGQRTHRQEWISWEIEKAIEYKKRIVAIKEKRNHPSPKELLSAGVVWVYGFNEKKIREAIED